MITNLVTGQGLCIASIGYNLFAIFLYYEEWNKRKIVNRLFVLIGSIMVNQITMEPLSYYFDYRGFLYFAAIGAYGVATLFVVALIFRDIKAYFSP